MAYKFTGRIKKLGYDKGKNFCEFDVDNAIKIDNEEIGVAYNEKKELTIVGTFQNIVPEYFQILSGAIHERFEIEFDYSDNLGERVEGIEVPENSAVSEDNGDTDTKNSRAAKGNMTKVMIIK